MKGLIFYLCYALIGLFIVLALAGRINPAVPRIEFSPVILQSYVEA